MSINEYIENMKKIQADFLNFIENEQEEEENYINLVKEVSQLDIKNNKYKLKVFLYMINQISSNHHHDPHFFQKIEKIIKQFLPDIQKYYSNLELFDIFKKSKRILIFLMEEGLIHMNEDIFFEITSYNYIPYFHILYFLPELKSFIENVKQKDPSRGDFLMNSLNLQYQRLDFHPEIYEDLEFFDQYRKKGENDRYICELIREDSIEEFITYVKRENYLLDQYAILSIYETNNFLLQRVNNTLIEYAAFFGSVQIFKYLYQNGAKITDELWLYAIHGYNPEIIKILEEIYPLSQEDDNRNVSYIKCFEEAIKCHHNDMAKYIEQNFLNQNKFNKIVSSFGFHSFNFLYFPDYIKDNQLFLYACENNYFPIFECLLKTGKIDTNSINDVF